MNLFNLFKKKPKFKDDLFGELSYTTFKESIKNFYEGSVEFHGQMIGILVDADSQGPRQDQKELFLLIRNNYQSLKNNTIIPFLNKELIDWMDGQTIKDFDSEFSIDAISIPIEIKKPAEWSITFYCQTISHYVTIDFSDFKPLHTQIDG
jgi:hypothetical protein